MKTQSYPIETFRFAMRETSSLLCAIGSIYDDTGAGIFSELLSQILSSFWLHIHISAMFYFYMVCRIKGYVCKRDYLFTRTLHHMALRSSVSEVN